MQVSATLHLGGTVDSIPILVSSLSAAIFSMSPNIGVLLYGLNFHVMLAISVQLEHSTVYVSGVHLHLKTNWAM